MKDLLEDEANKHFNIWRTVTKSINNNHLKSFSEHRFDFTCRCWRGLTSLFWRRHLTLPRRLAANQRFLWRTENKTLTVHHNQKHAINGEDRLFSKWL